MHIIFNEIRYKNILSTGNAFTTIQLNTHGKTLVRGTNGAGKSTIIDALHFVLFGTAYRKITKPQLINSINKKEMLVEVDFTIGKTEYTIRRGQKPAVFDIIRDGVQLDKADKITNMQAYLEKDILRFDTTTFRQLLMIGSASYVPFMDLTAAKRREIVEEMLDLRIIGDMAAEHKKTVAANKTEIIQTESEIKRNTSRISDAHDYNARMKSAETQSKTVFEDAIVQANEEIVKLQADKLKIEPQKEKVLRALDKRRAADQERNSWISKKSPIQGRINELNRVVDFFLHSDSCPTCKQELGDGARSIGEGHKAKMDVEQANLTEIENEVINISKRISEMPDAESAIRLIDKKINDISNAISIQKAAITTAQNNITKTQQSFTYVSPAEIMAMLKDKTDSEAKYKQLMMENGIYAIFTQAFKDDGVKTVVIKRYIPIINEMINHYLHVLDFFVEFELDETFNETIRSRFRDDFSYDSFSEGEKARISTAILLTWRHLSKRRNTVSSNILLMDEVFDGALDAVGSQGLMKIICDETAGNTTNIIVISHKTDEELGDFDRTLQFEKIKNFSVCNEKEKL